MATNNKVETPTRKHSLFVKIMVWALSILMASSGVGIVIAAIVALASQTA